MGYVHAFWNLTLHNKWSLYILIFYATFKLYCSLSQAVSFWRWTERAANSICCLCVKRGIKIIGKLKFNWIFKFTLLKKKRKKNLRPPGFACVCSVKCILLKGVVDLLMDTGVFLHEISAKNHYLYLVLVCAFEEKQICGHTLRQSAKQEPFFLFFWGLWFWSGLVPGRLGACPNT